MNVSCLGAQSYSPAEYTVAFRADPCVDGELIHSLAELRVDCDTQSPLHEYARQASTATHGTVIHINVSILLYLRLK